MKSLSRPWSLPGLACLVCLSCTDPSQDAGGACEPDDVTDEVDIWEEGCDGPSTFAWIGDGCREVCECAGPDCPDLPAQWRDCVDAHLECSPLAESGALADSMVSVAGHAPMTVGAFGVTGGELRVELARDAHAFWDWHFVQHATYGSYGDGVGLVATVPDPLVPGVYPVEALFWDWSDNTTGTLELTEVSLDGPLESHWLVGTFDTTGGDGDFTGSFAVSGAAVLSD